MVMFFVAVSATKCHCQCHKKSDWNKTHISVTLSIVINQRWYSKWSVWSIHASWHFYDHSLVNHYGMPFFTVISSAKCRWHSHAKLRLKQNNFSVTSSTAMIRGETLTVVATITCLVTLCATNSWSRHLHWVIIPIVMGDMRCQETKWARGSFSFCFTRQTFKPDRAIKNVHFVTWDHTPSIFQECRDHRHQMSWPSEWSRVWC